MVMPPSISIPTVPTISSPKFNFCYQTKNCALHSSPRVSSRQKNTPGVKWPPKPGIFIKKFYLHNYHTTEFDKLLSQAQQSFCGSFDQAWKYLPRGLVSH